MVLGHRVNTVKGVVFVEFEAVTVTEIARSMEIVR
jgi:hypothetical protein